jgi:DNA repair photolyase
MPIVQATLNPFSQKVVEIGSFDSRELIDPVSTIQAVIPADPGGCPTALLVSPLLAHRPDDVVSITARYLAACDSGPTTLAGVKRFPGDPKARVKHEIDEAMKEMLKRKQVGNPDNQEEKRLATEEALDLARTQLHKHNWVEEWRGFIICWSESIEHQRDTGIARSALPFDRIQPLLSEVVDLSNAVLKDTFPEW